ncbi:SH3 domain-containing protein [Kovacikia minuta CCNUW1]|uniref:SH3 domain-containing protein n=1 Tax=Kovacikia minuta TaxID=2931930 RepID=UPI001CCF7243|nr:SH3 domain-containing protein [Kovacikia minuta]UBF25157.1 SH3 domain-containing protein [Kovacikia minuta CCNUW1]
MTRVDKHGNADGKGKQESKVDRIAEVSVVHQPALLVGAGVALFAATAGLTSLVLHFRPSLLSGLGHAPWSASSMVCKTIATDPNPPLNVRSSPVSAPDNIIGKLRNGTQLTVVDENQGWLRISGPLDGWVFKELTVTSCLPAKLAKVTRPTPTDSSTNTLAEATEYYHAGNLEGAIALAQTIPANHSSYRLAQGTIAKWQQDWKIAETEYYASQKALSQGRWQEVLTRVKTFPDNRFWRAKLTPLVKASMQKEQGGR